MKTGISFLLVLALCACTLNQTSRQFTAVSFNQKQEIKPDIPVQKACWFEMENIFYLWQQNSSVVHIYHNGKHINSLGDTGTDKLNFRKLTDICLAPDGNLYLLDNFDRRISKIDKRGSWIAEVALPAGINPQLLAVSQDESFFVYDDSSREIVVFKATGKEINRFGRMIFSAPRKMALNDNIISVYDNDGSTYFFTRLGQFLDVTEGNCYLENNRTIRLEKYFFSVSGSDYNFAVNLKPWQKMFYEAPNILLIDSEKIITGKITYE
ncbi:MAG: hypothetical protein K9N06_08990 [Candidatus Cloacimonetes bacterium]|nr:hypothetical protein [Candidatus Cloacimonadota bacterium]